MLYAMIKTLYCLFILVVVTPVYGQIKMMDDSFRTSPNISTVDKPLSLDDVFDIKPYDGKTRMFEDHHTQLRGQRIYVTAEEKDTPQVFIIDTLNFIVQVTSLPKGYYTIEDIVIGSEQVAAIVDEIEQQYGIPYRTVKTYLQNGLKVTNLRSLQSLEQHVANKRDVNMSDYFSLAVMKDDADRKIYISYFDLFRTTPYYITVLFVETCSRALKGQRVAFVSDREEFHDAMSGERITVKTVKDWDEGEFLYTVEDVVLAKDGRLMAIIKDATGTFTEEVIGYQDRGESGNDPLPYCVVGRQCQIYTQSEVAECNRIRNMHETARLKAEADAKAKREAEYEAERNRRKSALIARYGEKNAALIFNGKVQLGMTTGMCKEAWGSPWQKSRTISSCGTVEIWIYGTSSRALEFVDGKLVTIVE